MCVCVLGRVGSSSLLVCARVRVCACMLSRSVVSDSLRPHVLQPWPGIRPRPLHSGCGVLAAVPPGKPYPFLF